MEPGTSPASAAPAPWLPTACILCENNCGIEVQLGGEDGRQFARLRGNRAHPVSKGYVCQKAGRLNHYQNSRDRVLSPLAAAGELADARGPFITSETFPLVLSAGERRSFTANTIYRDPVAGTPWHKSVPARLERIGEAPAA